jgi:hypothetical protein
MHDEYFCFTVQKMSERNNSSVLKWPNLISIWHYWTSLSIYKLHIRLNFGSYFEIQTNMERLTDIYTERKREKREILHHSYNRITCESSFWHITSSWEHSDINSTSTSRFWVVLPSSGSWRRTSTESKAGGRFCFTGPQNVTLYNMYLDWLP